MMEGRKPKHVDEVETDPNVKAAIQEMERVLGTKVRIVEKAKQKGGESRSNTTSPTTSTVSTAPSSANRMICYFNICRISASSLRISGNGSSEKSSCCTCLALCGFRDAGLGVQSLPGALDREPLLVEQVLDAQQQLDVLAPVQPVPRAGLLRVRIPGIPPSQYRSTYGSTPSSSLTSPILKYSLSGISGEPGCNATSVICHWPS